MKKMSKDMKQDQATVKSMVKKEALVSKGKKPMGKAKGGKC